MHPTQKLLIKRLVTINKQKYSTVTEGYSFEDNIVFHLKQLIKSEYVKKRGIYYYLTKNGLMYSSQLDLNTLENKQYKTLYVGFICTYKNTYLLRKHVFEQETSYKLPGGKPFFGENIDKALIRLLQNDIGIEVEADRFTYRNTQLKTQIARNTDVIHDNVLVTYAVALKEEEISRLSLRQENEWYSREQMQQLEKRWPEVDYSILKPNGPTLVDYEFVSNYNLNEEDL